MAVELERVGSTAPRAAARRRGETSVAVRLGAPHGCDQVDNATLIGRCRDGDGDAWDELVARYERLVYSIPIREGLGVDDAAEVSQATFETLVHGLDRIVQPERLAQWLMTVARRLTWRRRTDRAAELAVGIHPINLPPSEHDAEWERTVEIYDAVARLGDPCRTLIFGLFFDQGEPSYHDLAQRLDMAIGSVGPLRARCLARLRTTLDEPSHE